MINPFIWRLEKRLRRITDVNSIIDLLFLIFLFEENVIFAPYTRIDIDCRWGYQKKDSLWKTHLSTEEQICLDYQGGKK